MNGVTRHYIMGKIMPLEFRDKLGTIAITPELMQMIVGFVPPEPAPEPIIPEPEETGPWATIHGMLEEDNKTIHRVEQRGKSIRCTCQDFRINKNQNCKHIADARTNNKIV
jgi:hypothetical protein